MIKYKISYSSNVENNLLFFINFIRGIIILKMYSYFKSDLYRINKGKKIYEFTKKEIKIEGDNSDYRLIR